jgi:predicted membrane-bound dolichyl-phosphate-mannose-protein mannosyltransferase
MCTVAPAMLRRLTSSPTAPLLLLAVLSVLSLGARALLLDEPCMSPCRHASDHTLVFDEAYYVNAARVIAGINPPAGSHYAGDPPGTDPNAEHPQGVKLIMAASIELFGDGPFAWRLGSLLFGSLAILGLFVLVRSAGGGRWPALGACALMACDNLLLVHSRIGTLDIYVAAAMIWGVAMYIRGRPLLAGLVLAVGACFKLVAPYAVAVLVLIELIRVLVARRGGGREDWRAVLALRRLAVCVLPGIAVFFVLLWVMGVIATPYDDSTSTLITGGPFAHFSHMLSYAAHQTSPHGPKGIASYPWQWLFDYKPITYLRVNPSLPGDGLFAVHPPVHFLGFVSPPIMVLAVPSVIFGAVSLVLAGRRARARAPSAPADSQLAIVGIAWFVGTFVPFEVLSLLDSRTSYLYYMVIVMPGFYVAIAHLLTRARRHKVTIVLAALWGLAVLVAAVIMYPFTPTL